MVRTSKSASASVAVSAAPVENTIVPAVADVSKKVPKEKKVKAVAPKEVDVVVVEQVVSDVPVEAESMESALTNKLADFGNKIQRVLALATALKNEYKTLEKSLARERKQAKKASSKKSRKSSGNRQPSGFIKPTRISDELAVFLGKPLGTELARTAVSREINNYIRTNALQDKENGRKIIPDAKLTALLKVTKEDALTYFNLQRFMKHHFIKVDPLAAPVVAPVV
jgi:chromatin remodeling complex protein RSC6